IDYLKTQASGRGSFVPVELREKAITNCPSHLADKVKTPLLNAIHVKDGYYPIARYLMGDVLLVNDLQQAIDIWKEDTLDKTLVTLDGDIIDPHGVMTGGSSNGTGLLQRKREIKELHLSIQGLEGEIGTLEKEVAGLKAEMGDCQKGLEGLRDEIHLKEIELVNLQGELKREEEELSRLKARLNVSNFEVEGIKDEIKTIANRKAELSRESDEVEERLREMERLINGLMGEASNLSGVKEDLSREVTDQKVLLASLRERLEGLKDKITNGERNLDEIMSRLKVKTEEVELGRKEMEIKRGEAQKVKEGLEELFHLRDSITSKQPFLEEALNLTSQEVNSLETDIKGLKEEMDKQEKEENRLTLELKEVELNIGHLRDRMAERYGVDIESYIPPPHLLHQDKEVGAKTVEGEMAARLEELKGQIEALGEVSLAALEECRELEKRHRFLMEQQEDLNRSIENLQKVINRVNRTTRQRFRETFDAINQRFQEVFPGFFQGGRAELRVLDEGDILEAGIDIVAQPPGKRLQNINLLSGGEKALTAIALIFSIFLVKPSPFYLLDEVDAPLDDANIIRFTNFLKEMAQTSQFVFITHNKKTMEMADILFGVTMESPGVSKMVSVELT
ncbi:MAG: hypothetical protein HY878_00375, partial [Deltaproteobacteria bacterium]|nr:hypothetical protein [Deltaproteobacteria bacterium]